MKKNKKHSNRDWKKLAAYLSGENTVKTADQDFINDDYTDTQNNWKAIGGMNNESKIDIDTAWDKVYSRIEENGLLTKTLYVNERKSQRIIFRIAAAAVIIIAVGSALIYFNNAGFFSDRVVVTAASTQRNLEVSLPDGSKAWLNRNSQLSYYQDPAKSRKDVKLRGEAFFDIVHDPSNPFIINAGNARVKVLGTKFNVITSNRENDVEVFVESGKVMIYDLAGVQNIVVDPGYIGTVGTKLVSKKLNSDPNYISWKTDTLKFDGQELSTVFRDLKRVFDINIVADNKEILNRPLTATFDKTPQDSIISVICATFNLNFKKDGSTYHLME